MLMEEVELLGHPSISVQNGVLRFAILRDTGEIAELSSLRTGHDQLMADGEAVEAGEPRWGIRDDGVPNKDCTCSVEEAESRVTIAVVKSHDGCLHTKVYTFEENSARVRVTATIENQNHEERLVRERLAYNLMVGGEVENSGVLSHFVQRNSVTVPHYGHRFFVGKRPEYPTDHFFEDYEALEQGFQPSTFKASEHGDPRWAAVVDTTVPEGLGLRFLSPTASVELRHQYFHFPFSIYLVQTGPWTWLKPGDSTTYRYDMVIFDGIARVDYMGDGFLVGVDLERAIIQDERQEIAVNVLAIEPCAGKLGLELHTEKSELDDVLEWDLGSMERRTWFYSAGPFQGIARLKKLWYYVGKMAGEVGRPVPQVVLYDGSNRFERKFVVSPEVEEIMKGLSTTLDEARREYGSSLELVGALRACLEAARKIKRQEGDVEQLYRLWERAITILQGFRARGDWRVFSAQEVVSVASNECTRPWVEKMIEDVANDLDTDVTMGYPGRRSYKGLQLVDLAAHCAFCYAATGKEKFGRKAVDILRSFAADNALYGVTGAGNPLHTSMQVKGLLQAYDWVYERLTEDDHAAMMAHFLWLYDYTEQHANVTGHNDEIQEGGATACLAARFGYLDGSVRKLKRGVAVLRKHLDFVDEDGGWPECPNYNALIARSYFDYAEILYRSGINLYEETNGRSIGEMARWLRRVIYERGKFFVVYDLLRSDQPHTYTWLLNLDGTLTRNSKGFELASPGGAGLVAVVLGGYDVGVGTIHNSDYDAKSFALTTREIPQLRIETEGKSLTFGALLVPYVGVAPEVDVVGEINLDGIDLTVTLDGVLYKVCEA